MADNEIELSGKFGLPEFHGFAASIEGRWKRTWSDRNRELISQVCEISSTQPEVLLQRLEDDAHLSDVVNVAMTRAGNVADSLYREALARLIAGACDDAKIDEAEYAIAELITLQPLQFRAFFSLFRYKGGPDNQDLPWANDVAFRATRATRDSVQEIGYMKDLGVSKALGFAAVTSLTSLGWARRQESNVRDPSTTKDLGPLLRPQWGPSSWGARVLRLVAPNIEPE